MATHANSTTAPSRRQPPPIIVDRRKVASAIERLIAILDELDADPDLEPNGDDEPILAAPECRKSQVGWCRGSDTDREMDAGDAGEPWHA